jgi:hypothetical protein
VKQGALISTRYSTVNMLRTMEDLLGMAPLGLNDGLQRPMSDVFTRQFTPWSYKPIVPDVLRTTKLPLPRKTSDNQVSESVREKARPAHNGAYWAARMQGFDFKKPDHLDTARFNRIVWQGMKGEDVPYPTVRSGKDLGEER